MRFTLLILPQPQLDVEEVLYEIFERIGCGDIPSSGTFGNKEGIVFHDFQIVVPNQTVMNLVIARIVESALDVRKAALEIDGERIDLMKYFQTCR